MATGIVTFHDSETVSPAAATDDGARTYRVAAAPDLSFQICVPDTDEVSARQYKSGRYPAGLRSILTAFRRLVPVPSRVLDLGGYLGGFGLAAAAAGHEVAVVEANPINAALIRRGIVANGFARRISVIEAVVGESEGRVPFHAKGPYGHVLAPGSSDEQTHVIRQIRLPTLMDEIGWPSPDFIKMDIEGSEGKVLRGAASWFRAGHHPALLFEANGFTLGWSGELPTDLIALVRTLGYRCYEVDDSGGLRALSRFEPRCIVDYAATAAPQEGVLPPRTAWQMMRRSARALLSPSPQAAAYTRKRLLRLDFLRRFGTAP